MAVVVFWEKLSKSACTCYVNEHAGPRPSLSRITTVVAGRRCANMVLGMMAERLSRWIPRYSRRLRLRCRMRTATCDDETTTFLIDTVLCEQAPLPLRRVICGYCVHRLSTCPCSLTCRHPSRPFVPSANYQPGLSRSKFPTPTKKFKLSLIHI